MQLCLRICSCIFSGFRINPLTLCLVMNDTPAADTVHLSSCSYLLFENIIFLQKHQYMLLPSIKTT